MKKQIIYIGNCSNKGLYKYKFVKGKLIFCANTHDYERCTFLAKCKNIIYGVLEVKDSKNGNNGYVVSYIDEKDKITSMNREISYGQGPCHISVKANKKLVFVSNYADGYFTIYKMKADGSIGEKIYNEVLDKENSHMHYSQMLDDNLIGVVDLGTNTIVVYEVNEEIKEVTRLNLGENVQPRHFVYDKNFIYVVTECTCRLYMLSLQNKKLDVVNYQYILPSDVEQKENYTGCAIKSSKNNKFIYVSVRGHNSISVFKNCNKTLKLVQNIKCNGDLPRDIELSKNEKYLFVANQNSNNVSVFKRNIFTGLLKYKNCTEMESPTCIIAK